VVSFGFGGKLVVLKETSSMAANFDSGNQVPQNYFLLILLL
jgi:hypothetical protein